MELHGRLLLGAHQSIAGGVHRAVERGLEAGCDTVQIFVRSPNRWFSRPLSDAEVAAFREAVSRSRIWPVFAHASYLVNLAAPDQVQWDRSVSGLVEDLQRCEQLGLPGVVVHPGSHMGSGEEAGLARIVAALDEIHSRLPGCQAQVWLETTAGQGDHLGYSFSHLRAVMDGVRAAERLGVCFDTAHAFAAGYELRTRDGYEATWSEFDRQVGLEWLRAIHLNDSRRELGSRIDRHEEIGQGMLGLEPFRYLVNDGRLRGLPMTLETEKEPDLEADRRNLATLRALVEEPGPSGGW